MKDFIRDLSSNKPVPGGGGASALAGALGAALGVMVANLTVGKEKYKDVESEIIEARDELEKLAYELLDYIDKDAEAFAPLAEAYSLPSATDEEKRAKAMAMEPLLKNAALVPVEIMHRCAKAIELLEIMKASGSVMAVSDAACGAVLAKAAMKAAWLNVCVNTKLMKDVGSANLINLTCTKLLDEYEGRADEIYRAVELSLKC